MSYSGGYGTPPFPPYYANPSNQASQAPPQEFTEDTGEFVIVQTFPPWTEAGATSRFYAQFTHTKDGSIQPTSTAIAILDGNGIPWAGVSNAAITLGTVTQDPSNSNKYYSSVQFGNAVPAGDYVVQWTGTYTPAGTVTVLKIRSRRPIKIKTTKAPSRFFFSRTDVM